MNNTGVSVFKQVSFLTASYVYYIHTPSPFIPNSPFKYQMSVCQESSLLKKGLWGRIGTKLDENEIGAMSGQQGFGVN